MCNVLVLNYYDKLIDIIGKLVNKDVICCKNSVDIFVKVGMLIILMVVGYILEVKGRVIGLINVNLGELYVFIYIYSVEIFLIFFGVWGF